MIPHLDDNLIAELTVGALAGAALAEAQAHLDVCDECRRLLAAVAKTHVGTPGARAEAAAVESGTLGGELSGESSGPHSLPVGTRLGRFRVVRALGSGAMGAVYEANDPELQRRVAVKHLRKDIFRTSASLATAEARLVREARAMARLTHPSVVTIYDVGTAEGHLFIAMALVEGLTLRQWLKSPRSLSERLRILLEAGSGLAAAHEAGMVHRDFKPDNVLVGKDGRAQVTDFGLVAAELEVSPASGTSSSHGETSTSTTESMETLTRSGMMLGTPFYMAPEQMKGGEASALSDQFSYGVTLHEAIFGSRPFSASSLAELLAQVSAKDAAERRVPRSGAPRWLRAVIVRALATAPEDRFPSMPALLAELRRGMQGRRRRWVAAALGATLALAAVWMGARAASRREALCSDGPVQLEPILTVTRGPQLAQAFRAASPTLGPHALTVAQHALERYASTWEEGYVDACRARRITHTQSEQQLGLRMECLSQRKKALETFANTLISAPLNEGSLRSLPGAVEALPPLSLCADVEALAHGSEPPPLAQRGAVEAARAQVDRLRAWMTLGDFQRAREGAPAVEEAVRKTGYEPLLAELYLLEGTLAGRLGKPDDGEGKVEEALLIAERNRDDQLALQAELLRFSYLTFGHHTDEAEKLYPLLEAKWIRAGRPPQMRERMFSKLASLRVFEGKPGEAVPLYLQAVALAKQVEGPNSLGVGNGYSNLAAVQIGLGHYPEAVDAAEHALAAARAEGLTRNEDLARAYTNYGAALSGVPHRREESARARAEAVRLFEEVHTPLTVTAYLTALANYAGDLGEQGKTDEEEALYRKVITAQLQMGVAGISEALFTTEQLGETLLGDHRYAEARRELLGAIHHAEGLNVSPDKLAQVKNTLAVTEMLLGHTKAAEGWALKARANMDPKNTDELDQAVNRYVLDATRRAGAATLTRDWEQVMAHRGTLGADPEGWLLTLRKTTAPAR